MKLIAQNNPVLAQNNPVLASAQENPGPVSYLSAEIQNEFIHELASTVRNVLLICIKEKQWARKKS